MTQYAPPLILQDNRDIHLLFTFIDILRPLGFGLVVCQSLTPLNHHTIAARIKHHIDHCLEQGLTQEEAHYLASTLIDHADKFAQGSVFESTATLQPSVNGGDTMQPQGLHDFNTLINTNKETVPINSEKEYASWAESLKDNP